MILIALYPNNYQLKDEEVILLVNLNIMNQPYNVFVSHFKCLLKYRRNEELIKSAQNGDAIKGRYA